MASSTLALTPKTVNLELYGGDENVFGVRLSEAGAPVVLSGWTFQAQARSAPLDVLPAATATCTVAGDGSHVVVAWGELRSLLGANAEWRGVWDLQASRPGSPLPRTLFAGRMTVTLDVTRAVS